MLQARTRFAYSLIPLAILTLGISACVDQTPEDFCAREYTGSTNSGRAAPRPNANTALSRAANISSCPAHPQMLGNNNERVAACNRGAIEIAMETNDISAAERSCADAYNVRLVDFSTDTGPECSVAVLALYMACRNGALETLRQIAQNDAGHSDAATCSEIHGPHDTIRCE